MFSLISLSYACVGYYCYAKTNISFILVGSSTHVNLVEIVAMQKSALFQMLNSTKLNESPGWKMVARVMLSDFSGFSL